MEKFILLGEDGIWARFYFPREINIQEREFVINKLVTFGVHPDDIQVDKTELHIRIARSIEDFVFPPYGKHKEELIIIPIWQGKTRGGGLKPYRYFRLPNWHRPKPTMHQGVLTDFDLEVDTGWRINLDDWNEFWRAIFTVQDWPFKSEEEDPQD